MDLKALFSLMNRKGFYYFEGNTNQNNNNLYISFSTLHGGRGNFVDIRIGETNNDISCWIDSTNTANANVNDNDVFLIIESCC